MVVLLTSYLLASFILHTGDGTVQSYRNIPSAFRTTTHYKYLLKIAMSPNRRK